MKLKIKDFNLLFFEYNGTYTGLLMGTPSEEGNEGSIRHSLDRLSEKTGAKISEINLVKEYSGYFDGDKNVHALKPIRISFMLGDYNRERACLVLSFVDEYENPTDAMERILSSYKIKYFDWGF